MTQESIYELVVSTGTNTTNTPINGTLNIGGTSNHTGDYWTYPYWNTIYTYPASPIYMYELKCPRCKTRNWGQIDVVVSCKKCTAKLKAVSQEVDFEIPVG